MTPSAINKTPGVFGLRAGDLQNIIAVLQKYPGVEEGIIFGSRAKGNYKIGSDIDIVLKGSGIGRSAISDISYQLNEETQMPYKFDIVNYHTIANEDLKKHINRAGVSFFKRD